MKCKITFRIQILGSWDSWPDRAWGSVWPSGHPGCHSPIYLWDIQARIISYLKLAFLVCPISTKLYQVTQDSLPSSFCFLNAGILMVGCVMFLSIHYINVKYKLNKTWIRYFTVNTYFWLRQVAQEVTLCVCPSVCLSVIFLNSSLCRSGKYFVLLGQWMFGLCPSFILLCWWYSGGHFQNEIQYSEFWNRSFIKKDFDGDFEEFGGGGLSNSLELDIDVAGLVGFKTKRMSPRTRIYSIPFFPSSTFRKLLFIDTEI